MFDALRAEWHDRVRRLDVGARIMFAQRMSSFKRFVQSDNPTKLQWLFQSFLK